MHFAIRIFFVGIFPEQKFTYHLRVKVYIYIINTTIYLHNELPPPSTGGTSTDRSCQPCQAKERGLERGGKILRVGKRTDGEEMWVCRKMMKHEGNCQSCDDQLASNFSEKQFFCRITLWTQRIVYFLQSIQDQRCKTNY